MSKGWRGLMQSKRWSSAGLAFLAVLTIALIAATVMQNQERKRENAAMAAQFTNAPTAATTPAVPPAALFFGDSYFNGANGVSAEQALAYAAGMSLGYAPTIAGHGGTGFVSAERGGPNTPNYLAQLDAGALSKIDPIAIRLVVVEGGLNDVGQPADQITTNAGAVLDRMAKTFPTAKVVLLGPVATTGTSTRQLQQVVDALSVAAKTANVPFVDATGWVTRDNVGSVIGSDHSHPSVDGHKVLGERLATELRGLGFAAR